jgi:DNA repair protein RadC
MKKLPIKSWAPDDRPREKLETKGKASLSDAELIAIIIGSGNRQESALALSRKNASIGQWESAYQLAKLSIKKLTTFKGVGVAKAIAIITALELGKRRQLETIQKKGTITSSKDVFTLMQPVLGDLEHEEFWVLFLDNSNSVIAKRQISKGGLTATVVDVRLLYKSALELVSVAIIVCHNHPSGKLQPSAADKRITQKIKVAGTTLDIKLLDHLIITEKAYFSFADEGVF